MINMFEAEKRNMNQLFCMFQKTYIQNKMSESDKVELKEIVDNLDFATMYKFLDKMYLKQVLEGIDYEIFNKMINIGY